MFAGLYGMAPMVFWLMVSSGEGYVPGPLPPIYWHGHEMLFGFAIAAVCGFMLTAVPNWTRTGPFRGWQLGLLVLIWLAGRLAMWLGGPAGPVFVAVVDLAMIPVLALYIGKRLLAHKMRRNYIVLVILFVLFGANVMMHLEAMQVLSDSAGFGLNLGIYVVVLLVTLISGRVIPGFTANALRRQQIDVDTQTPGHVTGVVIVSLILAAAFDLFDLPGAGVVAAVAALALLMRMVRWKTMLILDDPLVWVLHVGHLWLAVGLGLMAAAHFSDGLERDAGLHALTAGAMGTMVLGMMTRVSLGHSGRELKVGAPIVAAYIMVIVGALLRVLVAIVPEQLPGDSLSYLISVAGLLWAGGYTVFVIVYWPILTRTRI